MSYSSIAFILFILEFVSIGTVAYMGYRMNKEEQEHDKE